MNQIDNVLTNLVHEHLLLLLCLYLFSSCVVVSLSSADFWLSQMRGHPIGMFDSGVNSPHFSSGISSVMTILPKGYCFIQPPPIAINPNDVVDIPDEGVNDKPCNIDAEELSVRRRY